MKNNNKNFIVPVVLYFICLTQVAAAQSKAYTISQSKSNHITISGTSSLHDWNMGASNFTGKAQFDFKKDDDHTLVGLNSLTFSLPVTNLKSDKKGLDKNAYEALNTDHHHNIVYTLLSAEVSPDKDQKFLIKTTGHLTISGVTQEVVIDVYCAVNQDDTMSCSGSKSLNMSDYKVEPPSFMFGAMKTGDAITLDFTMVYSNNHSAKL